MGKMFPSGVDESRRQNDYAHQVFEEDRDHTAHPRSQNHHRRPSKDQMKIKQEHHEQSKANEDSVNDADIDMEEHENAETEQHQTPEQQVEQYPNAPANDQPSQDEPVVPETQAIDGQSPATLTASTSHTLQ
jgi:hypothetical protein